MSSAPALEAPSREPGTLPPAGPPASRKRVWVRFLILTLVILAIVFTVWRVYTARKQATADATAKQTAAMNRPTPVQTAAVEQKSMPIYLNALGTVTPYNSVTLKARVTGELTKINFTEGQEVKQGQVLMVIDPRPAQALLDQARGQLARDQALLGNAQAESARYQALFKEGVVSKESLDSQQSNLGQYQGAIKSDQAAIESDTLNVKYSSVTSPINGRVGLRLVDAGNVITANTTNLIVINQFQPIAVYFTLPEDQLSQVLAKLAHDKVLTALAYDRSDENLIASGKLLTSDNTIDPTTGTAKLKAVFSNEQETLFPNQFVNIHLILEQKTDAIVIPAVALQHGTQGDFVWIVKPDKTVAMQDVKVLLTAGTDMIVESGLAAGQVIVVDGADRLRPGGKVNPIAANKTRRGAGNGPGQAPNSALGSQAPGSGKRPLQGPAKPGSGPSSNSGIQ